MIPGVGKATANRVFESIAFGVPALAGRSAAEEPAKAGTPNRGFAARLLQSMPKLRDKATWRSFVVLLEMLVQQEIRNNPSKQIELILTHGYEQYLRENYENA